jgi:hypothetical protein
MVFALFAVGVSVAFFIGSLTLLNFGRWLGARYQKREGAESMAGLRTVETAVFALIGLIVAFTISGALYRFDERRQLVLQEANAASTVYDRLGLFEREIAGRLRAGLKDYVQARVELYRSPHDFALWEATEVWSREQQDRILQHKTALWDAAVSACPTSSYSAACSLALQGLGNLFDVARLRLGAAEKHPPRIVYVMLFGLGLGSSLLAGFSMASAKTRSVLHMAAFAGALAFTLYVITELEFPRLGLIRIEDFDRFLIDVYQQMQ